MNLTIEKNVTSWDKSIYYFSTINTEYNQVWFFEDDVFFYDEESLLRIDSKYDNSDLLSNSYYENGPNWLWNKIDIKFSPPFYHAMACCVRVSSNLLSKIRSYADEHKTLFFLEALFPTLCKTNNMNYDTPIEFTNIVYRTNYEDKNIDKKNLFHPVKDFTMHKYYRDMLVTFNYLSSSSE